MFMILFVVCFIKSDRVIQKLQEKKKQKLLRLKKKLSKKT